MKFSVVPLRQLAENLPSSYGEELGIYDESAQVVKVSNIDSYGEFHKDFEERSFTNKELERLLLQEGELLVVKSSGSKTSILSGKTAICTADLANKIVASNFVLRLKPLSSKVDSRYLWRYLNSKFSKEFVKKVVGATTYPNLRWDTYSENPIPLPPLDEQRRIAAILDKTDAICRKRRESIYLSEEFLRSTFLEMFGDPVANPKGWDRIPISELLINRPNAIRTGPFGSQLKHSEFVTEGTPVLAIDNIVTNEFKWTEPRCLPHSKYEAFRRYQVFPRDVIVTIMGTTGRVAVAPDDLPECMSTKHLCVMTLNQNKADSYFIWATLVFDQTVKQQASLAGGGAVMEGWNMSIISNLNVRIPPLSEQKRYANILAKLKANQTLQKKSLSSAEILFNSLVQRVFQGGLS